jgi:hypothetical protein
MRSLNRTILVGSLSLFYSFGSDFLAYLTGVRDQGGTWSDFDGISVAVMLLKAVLGSVAALMLLLAKPPDGGVILPPSALVKAQVPQVPHYDLGDSKASKGFQGFL